MWSSPIVASLEATNLTSTTATLNGYVSANSGSSVMSLFNMVYFRLWAGSNTRTKSCRGRYYRYQCGYPRFNTMYDLSLQSKSREFLWNKFWGGFNFLSSKFSTSSIDNHFNFRYNINFCNIRGKYYL